MTEPTSAQAAAMVTPEQASLPTPQAMIDRVVTKVFGTVKSTIVKEILEANEIETLVELAMYDCDELAELQCVFPNPLVTGGVESTCITKVQAKKLSLLKQWYMAQPNPSSSTWLQFTKDKLDTFIMGKQSPTAYDTPMPSTPT